MYCDYGSYSLQFAGVTVCSIRCRRQHIYPRSALVNAAFLVRILLPSNYFCISYQLLLVVFFPVAMAVTVSRRGMSRGKINFSPAPPVRICCWCNDNVFIILNSRIDYWIKMPFTALLSYDLPCLKTTLTIMS